MNQASQQQRPPGIGDQHLPDNHDQVAEQQET
eukprot:CAMPEP_0115151294 /NCGR_PEP_ID=MMETSP0227-20121206/65514_1 /TAXON_ID=89957 /ORGANISM="Polarella glacialis, Strain CCMP 1383" /LENGTH=31 /DNA_ID= /DNA_START= /DNA_END= /DNA_ORIENTATION=